MKLLVLFAKHVPGLEDMPPDWPVESWEVSDENALKPRITSDLRILMTPEEYATHKNELQDEYFHWRNKKKLPAKESRQHEVHSELPWWKRLFRRKPLTWDEHMKRVAKK